MRTRLRHRSTFADADYEPPLAAGHYGAAGTTRAEGGCADARVRCVVASMYDQLPSDANAPWLADAAFLPAGIDDDVEIAAAAPRPASVPAYRRVARRVARHRRALLH